MKVKVIGSSSSGNCYIFKANNGETLIVECGVRWQEIAQAINFEASKISGCIVTHCHMDHAKGVNQLLERSIPVYASKGTFDALGVSGNYNAIPVRSRETFSAGSFYVYAFDVNHDVPEPLGFIIYHTEMGYTLFLTDTYYSQYKFPKLNNVMIEANYDHELLENSKKFLRGRTMTSHMSIDTTIETLKRMDLSSVYNIILLHLSDRNSNELEFVDKVVKSTGKRVFSANKGLEVDLSVNVFEF